MLKYSRYNHMVKIPDEDAYALLNFRTGAFARLSPLQKDLFERNFGGGASWYLMMSCGTCVPRHIWPVVGGVCWG